MSINVNRNLFSVAKIAELLRSPQRHSRVEASTNFINLWQVIAMKFELSLTKRLKIRVSHHSSVNPSVRLAFKPSIIVDVDASAGYVCQKRLDNCSKDMECIFNTIKR